MKTRKAVLYCPCGRVCKDGSWIVPVIDLAGFIRELTARDLSTFTFVKMTCPECFVAQGRGEYARQVPAQDVP